MAQKIEAIFKLRKGHSSDWTRINPILVAGEPGLETDTGKYKIGNGYQTWNFLPYFVDQLAVQAMINTAIASIGEISVAGILDEHIHSEAPHPVYDDGPSLTLLYENAKV